MANPSYREVICSKEEEKKHDKISYNRISHRTRTKFVEKMVWQRRQQIAFYYSVQSWLYGFWNTTITFAGRFFLVILTLLEKKCVRVIRKKKRFLLFTETKYFMRCFVYFSSSWPCDNLKWIFLAKQEQTWMILWNILILWLSFLFFFETIDSCSCEML